jgi:hypothetical protein
MREAHRAQIELAETAAAKASSGHSITEAEGAAISLVANFETGFRIGGHCGRDRTPAAYEFRFELSSKEPPKPKAIKPGLLSFWGVPNMFRRLLHGIDWRILDGILAAENSSGSKVWTGTEDELYEIAFAHMMIVSSGLPIREAVDLVHFSIAATINEKARRIAEERERARNVATDGRAANLDAQSPLNSRR